jgi:hypothetical protein
MKLKFFRCHLKRAFGYDKNLLNTISKDKDATMAAYLLEEHPEDIDATHLGLSHVFAVGEACDNRNKNYKKWRPIIEKMHQHRAFADVSHDIIGDALNHSAGEHNVELFKILINLPQVPHISSYRWDDILMSSLPKGDPEKRRIEKRKFKDRDGHPEILKMVRQAMPADEQKRRSPAPKAPTPK